MAPNLHEGPQKWWTENRFWGHILSNTGNFWHFWCSLIWWQADEIRCFLKNLPTPGNISHSIMTSMRHQLWVGKFQIWILGRVEFGVGRNIGRIECIPSKLQGKYNLAMSCDSMISFPSGWQTYHEYIANLHTVKAIQIAAIKIFYPFYPSYLLYFIQYLL